MPKKTKPKTTSASTTKTTNFEHIGEVFVALADMLKPAEEITVAHAAEKYRYVNQPGSYVGWWLNDTTPYMIEPMNTFTSRKYSGEVFVGPAQSGKTDSLIINTVAYCVKADPMDMMVVCPTMLAARDFSMRRIDRLHRHSEDIGAMLLPGADANNKFDKHYVNGMMLSLSWPTPTELAGKPIGRVVMTDFDRMPIDVDGDGNPYDLASMRTTTFGSYAMCLAESSPSHPIENPKWIATRPHEAPPTTGILALYNRGTMCRWQWPCPHCNEYFEGEFHMLTYSEDKSLSNLERARTVRMICPHCACLITPDDRADMNTWGLWVASGQYVDSQGVRRGKVPDTMIASYWLKGVAAAFTNWTKLVAQYLDAHDEYDRTGSEEALKKFYNNSLGEPYYPKAMSEMRLPEVLKSRADKSLKEKKVPAGARFLIATVDVQNNAFIVSVHAIMPGMPFDMVLVDRFQIRKSKREDEDGDVLWVKPNTYAEDWDLITEQVIEREYELDDDSGRLMGIKLTGCDSGGRAGVTAKAYDFYRKLRDENKHHRFILVKGDHTAGAPRVRMTYPDSNQRGNKAIARGDVPVLLLNSNVLKDMLDGRLDALTPGSGMYVTPAWLPDWFYSELCAETRTPKGWENKTNARNEAWDLAYYCIGLCISPFIRVEHLDWDNPPAWAAELDDNDFVRTPDETPAFAHPIESRHDFRALGEALA